MAAQPTLSNRAWGALAAVLWLGYALPLFFPPAAADCGSVVPPDAPLLARLFPDVSGWWVAMRLGCLLGASIIVALVGRRAVPERLPVEPGAEAPPPSPGLVWIALALAAAQPVAGFWASHLGRTAQLLYVAGLAAPALILLCGRRRVGVPVADPYLLRSLALVAVAWLLLRAPVAWHSPRTADAVDTLGAFTYLELAAPTSFNLLTDRPLKGVSALFFVLQGAGVLGTPDIPLTLPALQVLNLAWMALIAIGVGVLAARLVTPAAAPIAAAFFLFSPFALLAPVGPIALFHAALVTTGLLLLLLAIHSRRSPPAVAAFGALAGLGASHPLTLPITLVLCAAALWSAWQRPRLSPLLALVAALSFGAAVVPGRPTLDEIRSMQSSYSFGRKAWRPLEYILLGQRSPLERPQFLNAGTSGPIDIPLATLLTPFAIPRTPVRLWGDALYDPVGTGLAAAGIAAGLLALRRSALARGLLALLAVGLLPAFVSSTDRPSLTRTSVTHTVLPLFASLGFEVVRRGFAIAWRPRALAMGIAAAIAAAGMVLFDVVNPRILPASAIGVVLEALGPSRAIDAVILDHSETEFGFLQIGNAALRVPARPIPAVAYAGAADLGTAIADDRSRRVVFWTPGLEQQHRVSADICARWPAARVYTLRDRTGCSHALAAVVSDAEWDPALPAHRWSVRRCGGGG